MKDTITNPFRRKQLPQPPQHDPPPYTSTSNDLYQPPPGPPPSHSNPTSHTTQYAPPPGPPPSHHQPTYAPPPGPPPSQLQPEPEPPSYLPWMSVPDSALLPAPPSLPHALSPTANASPSSAATAQSWCATHPLHAPCPPSPQTLLRLRESLIGFSPPPPAPSFSGKITALRRPGTLAVRSHRACPDACLTSDIALWHALTSAGTPAPPTTVYFEVLVQRLSDAGGAGAHAEAEAEAESGIALGFVAAPYPAWRLPGWERASVGVHGDDGRRYVVNNAGGVDFTHAFREGEVVGIGMSFGALGHQRGRREVRVFFTRDGVEAGGWDLFEERDGELGGSVEGLAGERDLFGAVGVFGAVQFEARFRRDEWLYRPPR